MASTSTSSLSSSSTVSWKYEVFLSFRGADLRKTFVDHLYEALDKRGIYAYKDDKRLQGGESISDQLPKAIEQSRSAIVVFSRNYGSSGWCLDELEKIMECKEKLGLAVFPVFYDVDPSEVRRQWGRFGEGFVKAVERKADKADVWRKALQEAADLSGYDVRNTADGLESQCIKQIVAWILSKSCNIIASSDENLIGIDSRVSNLISLIGRDSDDIQMVGIWGMGGSGKTTVARVAFDEVSKHFDGVSFIESVREVSLKSGLPLLQKKILTDILMDESQKVYSISQGIQMIRRRLSHRMVLIVLDDVDDLEQLRALAGGHNWFGKGSRILITTRDEHLLKVHEVDEIYRMNLLTEDEAIQLLRRYAFKKCSPTEGYDELSLNVVRYAAGLPLTLKVLGSFLSGRSIAEWTSALERLKRFPEDKTLEILKLSFDSLNDIEKDLFLDIACFFKGWKKDVVVRILDSCGFYPEIGIIVLLQKCLITFSDERFEMHDLIQEMGRKIVYQLHPKEPGKHSRLWNSEDISYVLEKNMGTEAIEAVVSERHDPYLEKHTFDSKAFMSMRKLRLLHLGTYKRDKPFIEPPYLPDELQWLSWHGYPHDSLAESFQAPKLVGLEMPSSCILQLWKGKKLLDKLKFLDLRQSKKLIRTPDFSGIPNLKELNLQSCTSLIEVHQSIGDLQRLVSLDLGCCSNLVDFPSNIHMKSLEILDFSHCRKFKRFPELRGNMDRLSTLHLDFTAIKGLPSSIANLTKLVSIGLMACRNLLDLPETICTLKNLKEMILRGCAKLTKLPENLGHIESLEWLDVGGTGVKVLPSSIGHLKHLRQMFFSGCCELVLEDLMAHMTHIGSCLKVLDLRDCELSDHQAIPIDVGHLSFLENLNLGRNKFAFLPFIISQLSRLKILNLSGCKQLKALPELPSSIAILSAAYCTSLGSIESLSAGKHEWLWKVTLQGCKSLTMHEKCDQLYYFHEKEKSIITGQQPKRYKVDHLCSGKHCNMLPLLQSMLQGHAVVNHRLNICYTEGSLNDAIPKWFGQEVMKGDRFLLKLPPNSQNKIAGFAICAVFDGPCSEIGLSISLSERGWIPGLDAEFAGLEAEFARADSARPSSTAGLFPQLPGSCRDTYYNVWIGYISLKMLQRSIERVTPRADWLDKATQLLLAFSTDVFDNEDSHAKIESCAARIVCMDEVENSVATSLSSSFTCSSSSSLRQQHDSNFAAETTLPCLRLYGTYSGITLVWDTY